MAKLDLPRDMEKVQAAIEFLNLQPL
jgi:hypothetical protein